MQPQALRDVTENLIQQLGPRLDPDAEVTLAILGVEQEGGRGGGFVAVPLGPLAAEDEATQRQATRDFFERGFQLWAGDHFGPSA